MKTKIYFIMAAILMILLNPKSSFASGDGNFNKILTDLDGKCGVNYGLLRPGSYTANSTGGDFQVKFNSPRAAEYKLYLHEYDPGDNADEHVPGYRNITNSGAAIWRDLGKYVDGDNNRAEFYVTCASNIESSTLNYITGDYTYWD
ncbi:MULTISPECIES: hypothetical protein [Peribacillus]|uniref:hypothetical protein n=1 Tax=Peribacillus TaxID=2675229 RepID=UPI0020BDB2D7|nr:hypothetical protein [Peribacillus frigoritolerans]